MIYSLLDGLWQASLDHVTVLQMAVQPQTKGLFGFLSLQISRVATTDTLTKYFLRNLQHRSMIRKLFASRNLSELLLFSYEWRKEIHQIFLVNIWDIFDNNFAEKQFHKLSALVFVWLPECSEISACSFAEHLLEFIDHL